MLDLKVKRESSASAPAFLNETGLEYRHLKTADSKCSPIYDKNDRGRSPLDQGAKKTDFCAGVRCAQPMPQESNQDFSFHLKERESLCALLRLAAEM